jgi:hypothetical protein
LRETAFTDTPSCYLSSVLKYHNSLLMAIA